jgi:DNA-binding LacI/PurR family transcriptional regulator
VAQPLEQIAEEAVRLLMKQIDGKKFIVSEKILPTKLVIRESCGGLLKRA